VPGAAAHGPSGTGLAGSNNPDSEIASGILGAAIVDSHSAAGQPMQPGQASQPSQPMQSPPKSSMNVDNALGIIGAAITDFLNPTAQVAPVPQIAPVVQSTQVAPAQVAPAQVAPLTAQAPLSEKEKEELNKLREVSKKQADQDKQRKEEQSKKFNGRINSLPDLTKEGKKLKGSTTESQVKLGALQEQSDKFRKDMSSIGTVPTTNKWDEPSVSGVGLTEQTEPLKNIIKKYYTEGDYNKNAILKKNLPYWEVIDIFEKIIKYTKPANAEPDFTSFIIDKDDLNGFARSIRNNYSEKDPSRSEFMREVIVLKFERMIDPSFNTMTFRDLEAGIRKSYKENPPPTTNAISGGTRRKRKSTSKKRRN
jgi:hypothetical protein